MASWGMTKRGVGDGRTIELGLFAIGSQKCRIWSSGAGISGLLIWIIVCCFAIVIAICEIAGRFNYANEKIV